MNTQIQAYQGLTYFENSRGWWIDARDTYERRYVPCESSTACILLISTIRTAERKLAEKAAV